jgi:hypothetical protein
MREGGARDWAGQGQGLGASKQEGPTRSRSGHRWPARVRERAGRERARQVRASKRAGPTGMQEGASGGGGPGREAMAMAGHGGGGGGVREPGDDGAARIMLASKWRDHHRFLPPAGEVKDNVSGVELTGILHANPKPQELRAFFAIEK